MTLVLYSPVTHPEVETDGGGGASMILPGETEAASAGTQPCPCEEGEALPGSHLAGLTGLAPRPLLPIRSLREPS